MIIVMPDGSNRFGGSFYTNSYTTGNWEDFIAYELPEYIDANYRSIPCFSYNIPFISYTFSIMSPYLIKLTRDRVTDENADIIFLKKDHPLLNEPNKITEKDFKGWVQERGLYFANEWDERYQPLFSMSDKGEKSNKGSLLAANYGKGKIICSV